MLGTFFTLPDNWFASTTQYVSGIFDDVSPLLFLVIAILIATFVIEWLISIIRS